MIIRNVTTFSLAGESFVSLHRALYDDEILPSPRSLRWPGAKPLLNGRLLHFCRLNFDHECLYRRFQSVLWSTPQHAPSLAQSRDTLPRFAVHCLRTTLRSVKRLIQTVCALSTSASCLISAILFVMGFGGVLIFGFSGSSLDALAVLSPFIPLPLALIGLASFRWSAISLCGSSIGFYLIGIAARWPSLSLNPFNSAASLAVISYLLSALAGHGRDRRITGLIALLK